MRIKLLILIACQFPFLVIAQNNNLMAKTTIYLVRHAEKEKGDDPLLTAAGNQRAGDLMRALKRKKLQRVYVTQYRRTQMTSDSIRIQLKKDTIHYKADTTGSDLLQKMTAHNDFGKSILVIGHSNTIPAIIRKLGVTNPAIPDIPDDEFDNLFVVTIIKDNAILHKKKYGIRSVKTVAQKTMQPLQ
jgi:phosphohistidine phosphatase SixA